jgi:hypothetical protein
MAPDVWHTTPATGGQAGTNAVRGGNRRQAPWHSGPGQARTDTASIWHSGADRHGNTGTSTATEDSPPLYRLAGTPRQTRPNAVRPGQEGTGAQHLPLSVGPEKGGLKKGTLRRHRSDSHHQQETWHSGECLKSTCPERSGKGWAGSAPAEDDGEFEIAMHDVAVLGRRGSGTKRRTFTRRK